MEPVQGIVYVLTNAAMPNLIKIGFTSHEDVKLRMAQLYASAGVPLPFDCVYAARTLFTSQTHKQIQES
ncbi:MAG: GIY-YIG nuclease family protein [Chitinophagaceae bacterium]|nr:MAG: GIY-YIG nuclease family protein [Chitinophagaceae bacterium]